MSARPTLQELLPELAQFGDLPAVISFGGSSMQTLTFAELEDRAMRLAGGLLARGVGRGEPVALFAPNRPQWVVARLALIATGATAVLLDDLLSEEELSRAIADSGSRRIFTTQKHVAALRSIAEAQLEVIVLEGRERAPDGTRSWETLLGERPASLPESSPDDIAALFYTSGTTGPPKGVPLTHANILSTLDALLALRLVKPRDRALVPLPLHHAYPFIVGMLVLLASGSAMVLPARVRSPPSSAFRACTKRCTPASRDGCARWVVRRRSPSARCWRPRSTCAAIRACVLGGCCSGGFTGSSGRICGF